MRDGRSALRLRVETRLRASRSGERASRARSLSNDSATPDRNCAPIEKCWCELGLVFGHFTLCWERGIPGRGTPGIRGRWRWWRRCGAWRGWAWGCSRRRQRGPRLPPARAGIVAPGSRSAGRDPPGRRTDMTNNYIILSFTHYAGIRFWLKPYYVDVKRGVYRYRFR